MTAAANGLPRVPPSSATKTAFDQYSPGRLHQHQYANISSNNNNNNSSSHHHHQRGSPPSARHLRHLYEPMESMTAHRADPACQSDSIVDQNGSAPRGRLSDQVHRSDSHYPKQHTGCTASDNINHIGSHSHHGLRRHEPSCAQLEQRRGMMNECCHSASETGRQSQADFDQLEPEADQYANQLRRSQLLQQQQQQQQHHHHHQQRTRSEAPANFHTGPSRQPQASPQQPEHRTSVGGGAGKAPSGQQHVNFNRSSQAPGGKDTDDDETGESGRKKKYLTAKYGQQQMNLIKKRLKIEMWLHDQLQELAKASNAIEQDELDDIDIDLDLLLDMEDDSIRRRSLKKTLEPLSDLPGAALEKFIDEVLEQSKLL